MNIPTRAQMTSVLRDSLFSAPYRVWVDADKARVLSELRCAGSASSAADAKRRALSDAMALCDNMVVAEELEFLRSVVWAVYKS